VVVPTRVFYLCGSLLQARRPANVIESPATAAARRAGGVPPEMRMREPLFTETLQISIVVRDLERTMRTYVEEYGIGPWEVYEFTPETMTEMVPADYAFRIAVTMVGSVQWELVQPLEEQGVFAEFLAAKGEGVHHVAVGGRGYRELSDALRAKGRRVLQGGVYKGVTFSYLTTDEDLGVVTEIFDWPEGVVQTPDAVYPPAG
jgi:hypothetical protein